MLYKLTFYRKMFSEFLAGDPKQNKHHKDLIDFKFMTQQKC